MKVLNILMFDLKKLIRDKKTLLFMILIPFVMIVIFTNINYTNETKIPCGIVDFDNKEFSKEFIKELNNDDIASFTEMSEEEVVGQVQKSQLELGFILPKGFTDDIINGKVPQITLIKLTESPNSKALEYSLRKALVRMRTNEIIINFFKEVLTDLNMGDDKATLEALTKNVDKALSIPNIVTVEHIKFTENIKSKKNGNKLTTTIGLIVIFLMMTMMFSSGGVILDEKKDYTWYRLIVTPTNSSIIYLGNILSTFVKGWIQIALTILFSRFVLGVDWGSSIPALMCVMTVFILSAAAMGIFLSTIVNTNAQLTSIASLAVLCTSMVSGCLWPLELQPEFMQKIAVILPQYWVMKGMRSIIDNDLGFEAILRPSVVLLIISIAFFIIILAKERFVNKFLKNT
ncbi:ABC-2 family transporter [Anaerobacterium chartisolvens]|uniref:ABC-2 family transporter n=1 Tax=Anaerobacterium chartisolvens TaxID=1297424 RepID=A0A369B484_9FIRM|nr:ABC transporter permease [Anaerobacterium chartisolvens]RCX16293.1 ABC-2 family transporter [Anaerobacterium chartisolvens]